MSSNGHKNRNIQGFFQLITEEKTKLEEDKQTSVQRRQSIPKVPLSRPLPQSQPAQHTSFSHSPSSPFHVFSQSQRGFTPTQTRVAMPLVRDSPLGRQFQVPTCSPKLSAPAFSPAQYLAMFVPSGFSPLFSSPSSALPVLSSQLLPSPSPPPPLPPQRAPVPEPSSDSSQASPPQVQLPDAVPKKKRKAVPSLPARPPPPPPQRVPSGSETTVIFKRAGGRTHTAAIAVDTSSFPWEAKLDHFKQLVHRIRANKRHKAEMPSPASSKSSSPSIGKEEQLSLQQQHEQADQRRSMHYRIAVDSQAVPFPSINASDCE